MIADQKRLPAGVLVDTNILLLLLVGSVDKDAISRFKRTSKFTPEDFELALRFLDRFSQVVTTAPILAEASNLALQLSGHLLTGVFQRFKVLATTSFQERHATMAQVTEEECFGWLGYTDAAISALRSDDLLVLTEDFRLSQYLEHHGVQTLNFNHLRLYLLQ